MGVDAPLWRSGRRRWPAPTTATYSGQNYDSTEHAGPDGVTSTHPGDATTAYTGYGTGTGHNIGGWGGGAGYSNARDGGYRARRPGRGHLIPVRRCHQLTHRRRNQHRNNDEGTGATLLGGLLG